MALVNVSVCFHATCLQNLPWTIYDLKDDRLTLKDLFDIVTKDFNAPEAIDRIEARIGRTKENLDPVNSLG